MALWFFNKAIRFVLAAILEGILLLSNMAAKTIILFKIWTTNRFSKAKSYNFYFHKNDVTWPLSANGLFEYFQGYILGCQISFTFETEIKKWTKISQISIWALMSIWNQNGRRLKKQDWRNWKMMTWMTSSREPKRSLQSMPQTMLC